MEREDTKGKSNGTSGKNDEISKTMRIDSWIINKVQGQILPWWVSKESSCNVGDLGLRSGLGRSPGGGHGHSSILACRIPWTEEPGRLQSIGSRRIGHDWANNTFTFLFQMVVMVTQHCKCTIRHWILHLKMVAKFVTFYQIYQKLLNCTF